MEQSRHGEGITSVKTHHPPGGGSSLVIGGGYEEKSAPQKGVVGAAHASAHNWGNEGLEESKGPQAQQPAAAN